MQALAYIEGAYANHIFATCNWAGRVPNRFDVTNEETTRHTGLCVCRQPRRAWAQMLRFQ